jgi:hypothetical protein
MSGKAKQDAVPPAGTDIWEVTLYIEESEGHTEFAASLLQVNEAFAAPKPADYKIAVPYGCIYLANRELSPAVRLSAGCSETSPQPRSAEQCIFVAPRYQARFRHHLIYEVIGR